MITGARKTSVISAFSILVTAATAGAECAWVLWSKTGTASFESILDGTARFDHVAVVSASDTQLECEKQLGWRLGIWKLNIKSGQVKAMVHDTSSTVLQHEGDKLTRSINYVCLPDTVDPRGPKGAKR